jgi:GNAT superfamily N-acetyltransferase
MTHTLDLQKVAEINRIQFEHGISSWVKNSVLTPEIRFWRSHFKPALVNVATFSNFSTEEQAKLTIQAVKEDAIKEQYNISWWTTPFTKPSNLAQLLHAEGFKLLMRCKCLMKDLSEPIQSAPFSDVEIKRVTTKEQMQDYVEIVSTCFGYDKATKEAYLSKLIERDLPSNPMVEEYIAYYQGEPVCTALILIIDAETTSFYDFATLPHARNKGIGTSMMLFQLKRSQELGAKKQAIIAAPDSQNICKNVGFEEAYELNMYAFKTKS